MSISNVAEMYLLATLANGDWTQWYRGETNRGGLQPQLLSNPFFETDASDWTLSNCSWGGSSGSYTQGWIQFTSTQGTATQTVTGLTVGETYHVIVDGYGSSTVSPRLKIEITDGSSTYTTENIAPDEPNSPDNRIGITFEAQNTSVTVKVIGDNQVRLYEAMMRKNDRWLALYTAEPNESGSHSSANEVSGNGYARQPICFGWRWADGGDGESATMKNANAIEFPEATASWGTVSHIAVYSNEAYDSGATDQDDKYTNHILFSMALDASKTIDAGDIVRFERLTIELEADPQA